jgi:hypothetical protein
MTKRIRWEWLFVLTTVAEAWCQPVTSLPVKCLGCDCDAHHPGMPVEGCDCPCAH